MAKFLLIIPLVAVNCVAEIYSVALLAGHLLGVHWWNSLVSDIYHASEPLEDDPDVETIQHESSLVWQTVPESDPGAKRGRHIQGQGGCTICTRSSTQRPERFNKRNMNSFVLALL